MALPRRDEAGGAEVGVREERGVVGREEQRRDGDDGARINADGGGAEDDSEAWPELGAEESQWQGEDEELP